MVAADGGNATKTAPISLIASGFDTKENLSPEEELWRRSIIADAKAGLAMLISYGVDGIAGRGGLCATAPEGHAGPAPAMSVDCSSGPRGRCIEVDTPTKRWEYPATVWESPIWTSLNFQRPGGTAYHYSVEWKQIIVDGEDCCMVTATARADLDGDGVFSTIRRCTPACAEGEDGEAVLEEMEWEYE